ncbi:MAG: alkaline phosphatase family protein [Chitinivibrionia bacterium]|nr:alkaline phosphatase family protein [Chitinivibrionia bacterium]
MKKKRRLIVVDIAGFSPRHFEEKDTIPNIAGLLKEGFAAPLNPAFPAVTCTMQSTLLTGAFPSEHGIVANGFMDRTALEPHFWEQPSSLVQRPRIWDVLKQKDPAFKTAVLFWQNTMFADSDIVITPRPLHLESGMVPWCYSKPVGFYENLVKKSGEFNLMHYWGPMVSVKSSEWIMGAAIQTLRETRPDLLLCYIPHLDYSSQKLGIMTDTERKDLREVDRLIGNLLQAVRDTGLQEETAVMLLSEYALRNVTGAVCLNRELRRAGLLSVREIQGKEYIDFEMSRAFAMVDHQVAHIYVKPGEPDRCRQVLEGVEGVDHVWGMEEQKVHRIYHERSGELIAVARPDRWFAYYWWEEAEKAPDFTRTVDIHRKPGYDPLDLFFDPKTRSISTDTSLIKGSHGILPKTDAQKACLVLGGSLPDGLERKKSYEAVEIASLMERVIFQ